MIFHLTVIFPMLPEAFPSTMVSFFFPVFVGIFVYSLVISCVMPLVTYAVYYGERSCFSEQERHRNRFSGICFRKKST